MLSNSAAEDDCTIDDALEDSESLDDSDVVGIREDNACT
jgi:hypothetical protein